MKVGIIFHRNGSIENLRSVGQDKRFIDSYLMRYAKTFEEVYVFSYANETIKGLPENVKIIPNRTHLPASIYAFMFPLIHRREIRKCDALRVFHINGTPSAIVSRLVFGKPYITTYGYLWMNDLAFHGKYLEMPAAKVVEWIGLKLARKVIITIDKTKNHVLRFIGQDKVEYVPNGVDTNTFRGMKSHEHKGFRIVSVGRLYKIKNYDSLIRAASRIRNSHVTIYGNGPEEKNLRELARRIGCSLSLPGMVPNENLPERINEADVFVLPSHSEGMPKALLEAMSCQVPCIVSNLPTLMEIIKDGQNGMVCERSPEGIYDKLEFARTNQEDASRMASEARKYIVNRLSIDKLVKKEINLLKELVG